ncbi:uncharacterized protein VTP21DRAFT_1241 [Calcarisporiella thermophila]|uniref:uncharacterized protein n=1 Tax=Calcarisporiella thermophila TaxID=911321 RepID=UPI0037428B07
MDVEDDEYENGDWTNPMERPVSGHVKSPTYEYYGFVIYLLSFIAFVIYLLWAYLPEKTLHSLGISYYPSKYWALALPVWTFGLIIFVFVSFMSINLMNTAPFDSFNTITDEHAYVMLTKENYDRNTNVEDYIPDLHDIPIGVVNAVLYQQRALPTEKRSIRPRGWSRSRWS